MSNFKYLPFFQPDFELPIYCKSAYLSKISDNYGWIIDKQNNLGLPIIIKSKFFFHFVIVYGNIYNLNTEITCKDLEKIKIFYGNLLIFLKKRLNIDAILPSPAYLISNYIPTNSKFAPFGSLRVNLCQSMDVLWSKVHSKHRNSIRMAEKLGCKFIVNNSHLNEAIKIINETHINENISLVNDKLFTDNSIFKVVCVLKNEIIQSVGLFIISNEGAYYLYGSNSHEHEKGSMNFLHWNAMLYFKEIGVQYYDFVGIRIGDNISSKYITLRRFKERFGGDISIGYLWKIDLSFKLILLNRIRKIISKNSIDIVDLINKK